MSENRLVANAMLVLTGFLVWSAAWAADLPDFTKLVEQNAPAVVNISTIQHPDAAASSRNEELEEFFRRFFPPDGDGNPAHPPQVPYVPPRSLGSGFVIGSDGYILTNNHVVEDADEIVVRFNDRREMNATLVGADPRSDLAVLKVNATNLPTVKVGRSGRLKVGEWVLAIGSPFGFDYSVTAGIVSAKGRSLPDERNENYVPYIQTDVAINPGNSGGPLFNLAGEVVGINSQIYSNSGGFMGVSFAIPIDMAMDVVKQLRQTGHVSRGWLGVLIQEVNRDLAESFGLSRPQGALVTQVMAGSPADTAGLKAGDIITRFNGTEIEFSSDLPHVVGRTPAGSTAKLRVVRGGQEQTVNVIIGELADRDEQSDGLRSQGSGALTHRTAGRASVGRRLRAARHRRRRSGGGGRGRGGRRGHPARRRHHAPRQPGGHHARILQEDRRGIEGRPVGAGADQSGRGAHLPRAADPRVSALSKLRRCGVINSRPPAAAAAGGRVRPKGASHIRLGRIAAVGKGQVISGERRLAVTPMRGL